MRHPLMQKFREVKQTRRFARFPMLSPEAKKALTQALDLERNAGLAEMDGKPKTAEQFRAQARESWAAARALGW